MTRKDFVVVAKIIAMITRGDIARTEKRAEWVTSKLKGTNSNFDEGRFWDAVEYYAREYYK